jgi:hypothetical protein
MEKLDQTFPQGYIASRHYYFRNQSFDKYLDTPKEEE